jgi:DNA-binding CsgD family transcriptional regulator
MPKSQRLRIRDLRAVYLLIGECRELGADPVAWRQHLLAGLAQTLGATVGLSFEFRRGPEGRVEPLSVVEAGWPTDSDRRHFWRFMHECEMERCPLVAPLFTDPRPLLTRLRRQLVDDGDWYGSAFVGDYARPARVDEMVLSMHKPAAGPGHQLNVSRPWNAPPFGLRDRRLLHLCHTDIAALWGGRLALGAVQSASSLPPRLREVLWCLLEGDGEKQAAMRLGIRPQTVHEHVKRLHRRFGVSSRGELLARCAGMLPALQQGPSSGAGNRPPRSQWDRNNGG